MIDTARLLVVDELAVLVAPVAAPVAVLVETVPSPAARAADRSANRSARRTGIRNSQAIQANGPRPSSPFPESGVFPTGAPPMIVLPHWPHGRTHAAMHHRIDRTTRANIAAHEQIMNTSSGVFLTALRCTA
ncbi:hypothetical protein JS533_008140 [Bifidobacterium amazonense]|uniref:Secreted protein n=1 Tax=Bifidobacterium amazonense TaxID=2809027 RepID=A0ABS9VVW0_9BIFI|nr:hypothetical protein [Bifidobacterium amazonense]MCH9276235.1 hypothetical protein [Bifidobacterium amazonense]